MILASSILALCVLVWLWYTGRILPGRQWLSDPFIVEARNQWGFKQVCEFHRPRRTTHGERARRMRARRGGRPHRTRTIEEDI